MAAERATHQKYAEEYRISHI